MRRPPARSFSATSGKVMPKSKNKIIGRLVLHYSDGPWSSLIVQRGAWDAIVYAVRIKMSESAKWHGAGKFHTPEEAVRYLRNAAADVVKECGEPKQIEDTLKKMLGAKGVEAGTLTPRCYQQGRYGQEDGCLQCVFASKCDIDANKVVEVPVESETAFASRLRAATRQKYGER